MAKTFSGSLHKRKAIVTKKSFGWITGVGILLYYSHLDVRLKLLAFRCGNMKWGLMCSDHGNSKKKKYLMNEVLGTNMDSYWLGD